MKKILKSIAFSTLFLAGVNAQTNPAIFSWLQNNIITGSHYLQGNSTPIADAVLVNVQTVQYSTNWVYASTKGIPSYVTGPFLDGNPSFASDQNAIYKISLNPVQNTGTAAATTPGNIGVFINGVSLFDYRDGVAWNPNTNALCGGPGNPPCPGGPQANQDWNRDAIPAEKAGFDCAKGHPAMGNYHHHQNPSAFNLDLVVISNICDLYLADGLYVIDSTVHSPLIGFAYDGFPIYGAYGYKNLNGTGGITRMKSGYSQRNITVRNTSPTGASVSSGPNVSTTYPIGYFREDNEFIANASPDYLDVHNGRVCVTPEYPNGTYAYFATVDEDWNSTYPYVVGPTFYGTVTGSKVTSVSEPTTIYASTAGIVEVLKENDFTVYPNPASDLLMIQIKTKVEENMLVKLHDIKGKMVAEKQFLQGSTIVFFETEVLYDGIYILEINNGKSTVRKQVAIQH